MTLPQGETDRLLDEIEAVLRLPIPIEQKSSKLGSILTRERIKGQQQTKKAMLKHHGLD